MQNIYGLFYSTYIKQEYLSANSSCFIIKTKEPYNLLMQNIYNLSPSSENECLHSFSKRKPQCESAFFHTSYC